MDEAQEEKLARLGEAGAEFANSLRAAIEQPEGFTPKDLRGMVDACLAMQAMTLELIAAGRPTTREEIITKLQTLSVSMLSDGGAQSVEVAISDVQMRLFLGRSPTRSRGE